MGHSFQFEPVAWVHSPHKQKADAPRQGRAAADVRGIIRFEEGMGFEDALRDIESFDHLWLLGVFDRTDGWRPTVLPPRSGIKRGVFATRAPRRPNPIALTAVRLVERRGLDLEVAELDLLDGTPILDVKPYLAWADAIPDASSGWLSRPDDPGLRYEVFFSDHAVAQCAFLDTLGASVRARIEDHLSLGPRPHAYRRIRKEGDVFVLSVRRWRVVFDVQDQLVRVAHLRSSYKTRELRRSPDPTHKLFVEAYGRDGTRPFDGDLNALAASIKLSDELPGDPSETPSSPPLPDDAT